MTDIKVISIDTSYAQRLTDLGRRLFAATFGDDTSAENMQAYLDESYTVDKQLAELGDPRMRTFMALDGDTPIGFCQLRQKEVYDFIEDKEAIELQRIYVENTYKGKGIGKLLIEAAIAKAREMGKKTMWLGVWEFNPVAYKFYQRYGFYKVGSHIFKMGEQEDTDDILIKNL